MLTGQQLEKTVTVEVDGGVLFISGVTDALVFAEAITEAVYSNQYNVQRSVSTLEEARMRIVVTLSGEYPTDEQTMASDHDSGLVKVDTIDD